MVDIINDYKAIEMKAQTLRVPFQTWGNRQVLTAVQVLDDPWIEGFIKRFPNCFEFHPNMDAWIFYPEGDAPK